MFKFFRNGVALRLDPPDITALRTAWIRLHGPSAEGLGVCRAAGKAAHGLDSAQWRVARRVFDFHGPRDSPITEILRPRTQSLQDFSI